MTRHRLCAARKSCCAVDPSGPVRQGGGKERSSQRASAIHGRRAGAASLGGFRLKDHSLHLLRERLAHVSSSETSPLKGAFRIGSLSEASANEEASPQSEGEAHFWAGSNTPDTCEARDVWAAGPRPHLQAPHRGSPQGAHEPCQGSRRWSDWRAAVGGVGVCAW